MATRLATNNNTELSVLQQAIHTASYELAYERSSRDVEAIIRDEDVRKLKFQLIVLEDENDALEEQLTQAEENVENLESELGAVLARQDELESDVQTLTNDMRVKIREMDAMQAELTAFESISNDSNKLLKEKFALQTEISKIKPELEHLRNESAMHQELLAEKLTLQRQLSTVQVELENAQRAAERAKTKAGKTTVQDAEHEAQLDELHKQLAEAKQALKDTKREADRLQKELASEKKAAELAEATQSKESSYDSELKAQMEELRKELAAEKKERQKIEKALEKERQVWEAEKSVKEEKLAQFRTKLRSTKEGKTALEAEVRRLQEEFSRRPAPVQSSNPDPKNPRKRAAAQMDPEAVIGTPGDGVAAKRGKRATTASMPGDKSTFSITPFLNRTMSIAPDTPKSDIEGGAEKPTAADEVEPDANTPSVPAAKKTNASKKPVTKKPLAPASSTKQNANPPAPARKAKIAAKPSLEQVTEEADENAADTENAAPVAAAAAAAAVGPTSTKVALNDTTTASKPAPKLKPKDPTATKEKAPRKSLADFSTFALDAESGKVVKKKRKLLGGAGPSLLGKTLFDEEDADAPKPKPIPGRGLFAARALAGKTSGLLAAKNALKAPAAVMQVDGLEFSPLKKDRRAAKLAASMLGE